MINYLRGAGAPVTWKQLATECAAAVEEIAFKRQIGRMVAEGRVQRLKGRRFTLPPEEKLPKPTVADAAAPVEGALRARVVREGKFLFAVVEADHRKVKFVLPKSQAGAAKPGQSVWVKPLGRKGPFGYPAAKTLTGVRQTAVFSDVAQAFFKDRGLPHGYPKRALHQAALPPEPVWEEYRHRLDLREWHIVTIDPLDAKDHDDAVSLERLPDGRWKLGVHIADVGEYVPQDGALDEEAAHRAFTQYLPWTAVPMLPPRLSTDLCSLLEGRERLAFSCFLEVGSDGALQRFEFAETFLRVARFYSYEEAQGLKEEGEPFLNRLSEFTETLLRRRKDEGYLDFSLAEPKVELDANREPVGIYPGRRLPSHGWIEECMLLANQATARYLHRHKLPGLFRVHEQPDLEVVEELWSAHPTLSQDRRLRETLADLRTTAGYLNPAVQNFYVRLLDPSRGALPPAVQRRVLQSMKKAQYAPEPLGHFALGWQYYAHFTSPIRRYADLWTHRVMKAHLREQKPSRLQRSRALAVAVEVSERELEVLKVERKAMKVAMAWVFRQYVGREFSGEVSGVEGFGVFVTVSNPFGEGMIPVARMRDDYYELDAETRHLVGRRFGRRFELGQRVKIKVARSDPFSGQIDFDLLGRL